MVKSMSAVIATAERPLFGGDCLARERGAPHGKVLLVPGLIPGEVALVEIVLSRRNYDRARVLSVLEPSPHRVQPACPYHAICGGCSMLHVEGQFQVELGRQVLEDIFLREGLEVPPIQAVTEASLGYRCRMQLTNGGLQGRGGGREVVPITACPCATPEINRWLEQVPPEQRQSGRLQVFGDRRVCGEGKVLWALTQREDKGPRVTGRSRRRLTDKVRRRFCGTLPSPETTCTLTLSPPGFRPKEISFDVRGFFQSNLTVLEKAISLVLEHTKEIRATSPQSTPSHALDLYSGAGTMAAFLSDHFDLVTLVEHNRDSLVFAGQNLKGRPHQSYGVSAARWAGEFGPALLKDRPPELAFIDPPRSGMERAVQDFLAASPIPHIAYLSCDPATQARDCRALREGGYHMKRLFLLDFYPNTGHLEILALLERPR